MTQLYLPPTHHYWCAERNRFTHQHLLVSDLKSALCNFSRFWIIRLYFLSLIPGHRSASRPCLALPPPAYHIPSPYNHVQRWAGCQRGFGLHPSLLPGLPPPHFLHWSASSLHLEWLELAVGRQYRVGKLSAPAILLLAYNLLLLVSFLLAPLSHTVTHHITFKFLLLNVLV